MDQLALAIAIKKVGDLPALPNVTNKVLSLIDSPSSNAQDVCRILMQDQVLTTKVLRLVNSAYYGLPRQIATLTEAVNLLGFQTLRTMVLGVSVYKSLAEIGQSGILSPEQIWKHSIATAAASKIWAQKLGYPKTEEAFITGLLHDIGKIALSNLLTEEYRRVMKIVENTEKTLLLAEREVLSFDHGLIGKIMAEKWNLPDSLVEPIGFHHEPGRAEKDPALTNLVHLGNATAVVAGFGLGNDRDFHLDNRVLNQTDLCFDDIVEFSAEVSKWVSSEILL